MTDWKKQFAKRKREMGYNGCNNCLHQIEPLRMCYWAEHDGDGVLHLFCPKWEKREQRREENDY